MQPLGTLDTALGGLQRQLARFDRAASAVVDATSSDDGADGADSVAISADARQASDGAGNSGGGVDGAMVDLRVAKYMAVANLKVLQASNDMAKELTDLIRPAG